MRARVIGLGQAAAGDDGVGLIILRRLRERGVPAGVELVCAVDDVALISLLQMSAPVVLVDAVIGAPRGKVLELTPRQLAGGGLRPVSTHGIGVSRAIELARTLAPRRRLPLIRIVAVTIDSPQRWEQRLSPEVAAAVPVAADRVVAVLGEAGYRPGAARMRRARASSCSASVSRPVS